MLIGEKRASLTDEYSVYPFGEGYLVELNGSHLAFAPAVEEAHKVAARHAREHGIRNAGLTEVFGRNRQFLQGPRGGWKRYKGES